METRKEKMLHQGLSLLILGVILETPNIYHSKKPQLLLLGNGRLVRPPRPWIDFAAMMPSDLAGNQCWQTS